MSVLTVSCEQSSVIVRSAGSFAFRMRGTGAELRCRRLKNHRMTLWTASLGSLERTGRIPDFTGIFLFGL